MPNTTKPSKHYDHAISLPGAPVIGCHQDERLAGAFMKFDDRGDGQLLNLVAQRFGNQTLTYVGYRDGKVSVADKLAISVNADKSVSFQIVLAGHHEDQPVVETLTLAQLEQAVREFQHKHATLG